MIAENLKLLFKFYVRPLSALSDAIDRGSLLIGAVLVTCVASVLALTVTNRLYESYEAVPIPAEQRKLPKELQQPPPEIKGDPEAEQAYQEAVEEYEEYAPRTKRFPLPLIGNWGWRLVSFNPTSMLATALSLAALYVPGAILALVLIVRNASFGVAFRRDYGSLLVCTLMAWAASHLPFALAGAALVKTGASTQVFLLLWLLSSLYFGALMVGALRTACGASVKHAVIVVCLVWVVLRADSWLFSIATWSPFLTLIWILPLVLGAVYGVRASYIQRQNFRRYLDSCTINPRDAEAHYQLGLVYQQRRQHTEASARFKRAVEIDPQEPDANYEMGRVAREQGRLQDAINHFSVVLAHNDKFRQSEIWREVGATYLAAGMHDEALDALKKYTERRPYDPEGLYHLGETLQNMGRTDEARQGYKQCIEAVQTMPYYRRNEMSKWSRLAQARMK